MTADLLMAVAYRDCLLWATREPEIIEAFRREAGVAYRPARTPLDAMIDEATGAHKAIAEAFIAWFNVHVWGDDVPAGQLPGA